MNGSQMPSSHAFEESKFNHVLLQFILILLSGLGKVRISRSFLPKSRNPPIKISRIWPIFFPQTHRISHLGYFFHHFWRYFRFLLRSLPLTYHLVHPKQVGQGE